MENNSDTQLAPLTDDTRKELETNRRQAEEQLKYYSRETESWRQLIVHLDGILGSSQNGLPEGEKFAGLTPTEFVMKLLHESPDKWISIGEFLFKARSAFDAGEVTNRTGTIENSIHSVLWRFRRTKRVWTKGRRETRKFKLKQP